MWLPRSVPVVPRAGGEPGAARELSPLGRLERGCPPRGHPLRTSWDSQGLAPPPVSPRPPSRPAHPPAPATRRRPEGVTWRRGPRPR